MWTNWLVMKVFAFGELEPGSLMLGRFQVRESPRFLILLGVHECLCGASSVQEDHFPDGTEYPRETL